MVKVQLDLSEKANKNLEGFMFINESVSKQEAVNKILEQLNLKEDMNEWLNKDNDSLEV